MDEILAITYWWSRGVPVSVAMHETGHSPNTIVDWYNFHRDVHVHVPSTSLTIQY